MEREYLLKLFRQFCDANYLDYSSSSMADYSHEFTEWIHEYSKNLELYSNYLAEMGLVTNSNDIAVVGKGYVDSLPVKDIMEISPYVEDSSELFVENNGLYVKTPSGLIVPDQNIFVTYNSYTPEERIAFAKNITSSNTFGIQSIIESKFDPNRCAHSMQIVDLKKQFNVDNSHIMYDSVKNGEITFSTIIYEPVDNIDRGGRTRHI